MSVPPEAVRAAALVLSCAEGEYDEDDYRVAEDVLEAAAPAIRAAAFPRCPTPCDDDCEQACHEVHDVPRRREHYPETCRGTQADGIRAAERDRIRQLALNLAEAWQANAEEHAERSRQFSALPAPATRAAENRAAVVLRECAQHLADLLGDPQPVRGETT